MLSSRVRHLVVGYAAMRWVGLFGFWVGIGCASSSSVVGGRAGDAGADGCGVDGCGAEGGVRSRDAAPAAHDDAQTVLFESASDGRSQRHDASTPGETKDGLVSVVSEAATAASGDTSMLDGTTRTLVSMATSNGTGLATELPASISDAGTDAAGSQFIPDFTLTHDWLGVKSAYCHALLYCWQLDGEPLYLRLHFERATVPMDACLEYFEGGLFGIPELENGQLTFDWERVENIAECRERAIHVGELMVPLTEPGAECRWDEQCRGGICDTAVSCPSVCLTGLATGEECESSDDCADRNCSYGRCVAPQPPVFDLPLGAQCSWDWDNAKYCGDGSRCSREQYCVEVREAGEPCDEAHPFCPRDYVCADDETGAMSCAKVSLLPLGAACSNRMIAVDGALGVCDSMNLEICRDGICQRPPAGYDGDACVSVDLESTCNPGLYCEWGTNICRPLKAVGETCGDANECQCVNGVCSQVDCSER